MSLRLTLNHYVAEDDFELLTVLPLLSWELCNRHAEAHLVYVVLGTGTRALRMPGKISTTGTTSLAPVHNCNVIWVSFSHWVGPAMS